MCPLVVDKMKKSIKNSRAETFGKAKMSTLDGISEKQREAIKEAARRELAKREYLEYCIYTHRGHWIPARHNRYICTKLQQVEEGKIKRLMIFLPPRHGKSMTVTETFPSYFIAKQPDRRVIEVSYGDSLAQRFGKYNRQKVAEYGKTLFGVELSREKSSMTDWDIAGHRGGMVSVGIGGGITGQGADLLLVDDPIKNKEEADSEVYRAKIWDEWQNTLLTRLHPGAAIIIILTRWHEDDLAGRLLNPEYGEVDDWEIICLPAIAEDNDQIGRQPGDPLWPEHGYDLEWAAKTKTAVGSQAWAALYQQRPSPAEGAMLKRHWWRYYVELPKKFDRIIQSWDLSFKDSDGSDFVSGQVWGSVGADIYMLPDREYGRMDFPATLEAIARLTKRNPRATTKLVEDKANGPAVIAMLRHKIGGIIPINPKGSKQARVSAVTPLIEAGNVYLPSPMLCPWIEDFIDECASFPNGAHDDQVDAMTQALQRFMYARDNTPQSEPHYNFECEKPKKTGVTVTEDFFKGGWS
jgi:predicted phage terminase large subunit-like protein